MNATGWLELGDYNTENGITEPQTYIYGLFDPDTGQLRYVGKSDRPRERFANQLNEQSNTHRCNWIRSLLRVGRKPVQRIIDHVPLGDDWQSVERAYIRGARAAGCQLVNGTDGGDGVPGLTVVQSVWLGRKHTDESKRRIGAASRGRRHSEEYKRHMSELMRAREFTVQHRQRLSAANRKLNSDQVRAIRLRLAAGEMQPAIAADYGVDKGTVSNIKRGVSYSGIGEIE